MLRLTHGASIVFHMNTTRSETTVQRAARVRATIASADAASAAATSTAPRGLSRYAMRVDHRTAAQRLADQQRFNTLGLPR